MRYLLLYFKGMLMGAADLVPGVSGGTIALITGIYKELLDSINAVSWSTLKLLKKEGIVAVWKKNKRFLFVSCLWRDYFQYSIAFKITRMAHDQ